MQEGAKGQWDIVETYEMTNGMYKNEEVEE